jgi:Leucine-rich repeat (LRR) protein
MKKLLLILLCVPLIGLGQQTYVPDDNFEQRLIDWGYDNILDDYVTTSAIDTITSLAIFGNYNIADFTGIEDFIDLTILICWNNQITSLDVSNNPALTYLDFQNNQLTTLDVSNNPDLTYLDCADNQLTTLDVGNNTDLTHLECQYNQITSLDVSNNTSLDWLNCRTNQLTSLDVSNSTALTYLECRSNPLTYLDISNTLLQTVSTNADPLIPGISVGGGELRMNNMLYLHTLAFNGNTPGTPVITILDINNNPILIEVHLYNNQLTSLNINNNPALEILRINNNNLTNLDLSGVTSLTSLECQDNQITSLNISNNTDLTSLECNNNQLSNLIFNNDIEYVDCSGNLLTCIDVNSTTNLINLNCSNNMLEQLSIKNNNWLVLDVNALSNNLSCVEVDNLGYATNNWDIDGFASFSLDCNYVNPCSNTSTAIQEFSTNKELLKVTDILGRDVEEKRNTPLFYIYNDGTVEKKIIIE